jgi:hypothetical protein
MRFSVRGELNPGPAASTGTGMDSSFDPEAPGSVLPMSLVTPPRLAAAFHIASPNIANGRDANTERANHVWATPSAVSAAFASPTASGMIPTVTQSHPIC